jgi:uridylate kinase
VKAIPQKPGMHAPVDHSAMKLIMKHKVEVVIIGRDMRELDNYLSGKKFIGTTIK